MDAIVNDTKPEPELKPQPDQITIKLRKPVSAHGDMVKELTFREPTGADIMSLGDEYPITIDWTTGIIKINPAPMGTIMSLLAAVPPSTIRMLKARDWSTCAHALMGFFPPDEQAM
jgi:Phage tail assembly chaperone proteins, E, or 41 or 14